MFLGMYGNSSFLVTLPQGSKSLSNEFKNLDSYELINISGVENEKIFKDTQSVKSKIEKLSWVESVITIIDVPLLKSSDEGLMERLKNYKTLAYPEINKERGFNEILNSPIYRNYVISEDGKTSGIVVYLKKDKRLAEFISVKEKYYNQLIEVGLLCLQHDLPRE